MYNVKQPYLINGIQMSKQRVHTEDTIEIIYNGLLMQAGADKVYACIGYGENWEAEETIEMVYTRNGYKLDINAKMPGVLKICFKDSANNWDNNSCQNYSVKILSRKSAGKIMSRPGSKS